MLMSLLNNGYIVVLMANSGLDAFMKAAFGGVAHKLTGKNFPQNVRALRMVAKEIIGGVLKSVSSHNELMSLLKERTVNSWTTKIWVDC